ncbi:MAG: GGDEF domain-containing protein [Acidiferrobacterales bacterium]
MNGTAEDRTIREDTRAAMIPRVSQREKACLTLLYGGPIGTEYPLTEPETVIGRGHAANICIENQRVSRRHALLTIDERGNAMVVDLGSSNGTSVNGIRIQRQELKDGDKIQIGYHCILKFSRQDEFEQNCQQELAKSRIEDAITGAYTKKYLLDRLDGEYAHVKRHGGTLILLMFEIDHFKKINGTHGQPVTDAILKELACLTNSMLRANDILARYDDAQFALLARDIGDEGAVVLAQRIRRAINGHKFLVKDTRIPITVSLGVASLSDEVEKAAKLIKLAGNYLKKAQKKGGANSVAGNIVKAYIQNGGATATIRPTSSKGMT